MNVFSLLWLYFLCQLQVKKGFAKAAALGADAPRRNQTSTPFLAFCAKHERLLDPASVEKKHLMLGRAPVASELVTQWRSMDEAQRRKYVRSYDWV